MADVAGRSILVTGASGGLGSRIVTQLASRGARVAMVTRDPSRLPASPENGVVLTADLAKAGAAQAVVDEAVDRLGGLDGVVVASGVVAFGPATQTPDEVLVQLFTVNTLAPIRLLRAAAEPLAASAAAGYDAVFASISAVVAEQPVAGMAGYGASKSAVSSFAAAASRELRRRKVRVLDARPPHTETGLAGRPIFGSPPSLPTGLDPDAVAARIVDGIESGERDLPSSAFA